MITTMRGCVVHNELWPWSISSRSFRHDFAIKLLKYVTSCRVRSTVHTVLHGFFQYLAQMTTSIRECVMHNDLWSWPISSRSFRHDFAIKLLKYVTSCHIRSTAHTVLDRFFPYLAQMTTSMKECLAYNDLWPIFKVIQPWFCNKTAEIWHILPCSHYSTYSSGWILSIFGTMLNIEGVSLEMTLDLDLYHEGYLAVTLPVEF